MDQHIERAQLLARFKLQVKRSLGTSVDLEALTRDAQYAQQRLSEIEEAATEEDLLVMVLRLRDMLLPPPPAQAGASSEPGKPSETPPPSAETRRYLMGARSW
ncbi:MAG: hypothetical protein ACK4FP_13045 [Azonexus sp.]